MKPLCIFCLYFLTSFLSASGQKKETGTDKLIADSIFMLARKLMMQGKADSAELQVVKGLELATLLHNDTLQTKFLLERANITVIKGDKKSALSLLQQIAPSLNESTPYSLHDKFHNLMGTCYRTLLEYDSAIYHFRECEKLNNLYNPYRNWLVYYQLATLFMVANLPKEAEVYFWKSYAITKPRRIRADHGVLLNEFAGFLSRQNMPEKFSAILREYNEITRSSKIDFTKDPVHRMLFVDLQGYSLSEKQIFMTKVKESLLKNGDTINGAFANNYIARFYENENKPDEALKYIYENLGPLFQKNHLEYQYINSNAAYRLLKKAGNDKEAIRFADLLMKLKDSINLNHHRDQVLELEARYQSEKKEKEIAILNSQNAINEANLLRELEVKRRLQAENIYKDSIVNHEKAYSSLLSSENFFKEAQLRKELELKAALNRENDLISSQNRVKEEKLQKERKVRGLLIGAAALLLVSAIIILHLYRKQRLKNRLIQKQADELEVLMKEIHHRVKNNMQIVSSLLDLQSNTIKDDQAAEAVKEGKNRVQSMAIIHQHLYQEGNVRAIKMDDYVNTLARNLFSSYNVNPEKVLLKTDIEKLNLDIDTVIPLGLIINELVSNSLKYAFNNESAGKVYISLKEKNNFLELLVKDNGRGFPSGLNVHKTASFGLQLIGAFAQKLKAKLDFYNDNGAAVYMQIKKFRLAGA